MAWFFLLTISHVIAADTFPTGIVDYNLGRDFGVFTGDVITHRYTLQVPAEMTLSEASLPSVGELDYWLELISVEAAETEANNDFRQYQVTLKFQTFYAPLDVRRLQIPSFQLSFNQQDDTEVMAMTLPLWAFTMSPLKQIVAQGVNASDARTGFMKNDLSPRTIPTKNYRELSLSLAIIAAIALMIWGVLYSGRFRFAASPFATAKRRVKRLSKETVSESNVEKALIAVHSAFNRYAGHPVFGHQIDSLLKQYPEFEPHREKIEYFFAASSETLFSVEGQSMQFEQLTSLCKSLSGAERIGSN